MQDSRTAGRLNDIKERKMTCSCTKQRQIGKELTVFSVITREAAVDCLNAHPKETFHVIDDHATREDLLHYGWGWGMYAYNSIESAHEAIERAGKKSDREYVVLKIVLDISAVEYAVETTGDLLPKKVEEGGMDRHNHDYMHGWKQPPIHFTNDRGLVVLRDNAYTGGHKVFLCK